MKRNDPLNLSLAAAILIFSCSCSLLMVRPPVRISRYCGDGTISHIKDVVDPGFKIDFEPFSLSKPFAVRYKLDCLPKPWRHGPYLAGILLDLTGDEDAVWPRLPAWLTTGSIGTLALRLQDQTGRILFDNHADVGTLYWDRFWGDSPFGVIKYDPIHYVPWVYAPEKDGGAAQEPWVLQAEYRPGADSPERTARIRFTAGGKE